MEIKQVLSKKAYIKVLYVHVFVNNALKPSTLWQHFNIGNIAAGQMNLMDGCMWYVVSLSSRHGSRQ